MSDIKKKLIASGLSAAVFAGVSLPHLYNHSNKLLQTNGVCPNYKSKLAHMLVFVALSVLLMKYVSKSDKSLKQQIKYSIWGALLFFFISSEEMYRLTSSFVSELAVDGCPSVKGLAVHTGVYAIVLYGLMLLAD
jgi:hypothetical protein